MKHIKKPVKGAVKTRRSAHRETTEMPAGGMAPYVQWRVVKWGECDPAGVTYTPRTLDWAIEAFEGWVRDAIGMSWIPLNFEKGLATPVVRAEVDFHKAMRPDLEFRTELRVEKLGKASLRLRIDGFDGAKACYFTVHLVTCLIDRKTWAATPFPPGYRKRITAYQKACDAAI